MEITCKKKKREKRKEESVLPVPRVRTIEECKENKKK